MIKVIENIDYLPPDDPWRLFGEWLALAQTHEPNNHNAMALATVGTHGMPSVRMVLLKEHDPRGLVFFTNHQSAKGGQLDRHPKAAACFYWKSLQRQVRVEGDVTHIAEAESDAYFATRLRGTQIGAWASEQSRELVTRTKLEDRAKEFEKKFEGRPIPRPSHWGGFRIAPVTIEFWQEREFRLHDRIVYHRADPNAPWSLQRLYP